VLATNSLPTILERQRWADFAFSPYIYIHPGFFRHKKPMQMERNRVNTILGKQEKVPGSMA
jgi:hypothetical protein